MFYGSVWCIVQYLFISACVFATMPKDCAEKFKERKLTKRELIELNCDFWMKQELNINNKDFFECIYKNEIDLMILWIKFFKTIE